MPTAQRRAQQGKTTTQRTATPVGQGGSLGGTQQNAGMDGGGGHNAQHWGIALSDVQWNQLKQGKYSQTDLTYFRCMLDAGIAFEQAVRALDINQRVEQRFQSLVGAGR